MDMKDLARLGAKARIAELIAEIESLIEAFPGIGKTPARAAAPEQAGPRKRRKMSAATKAKLRASWARRKAGTAEAPAEAGGEAPAPTPRTKKRTLSAAGRERIIAGQKKRWAKKKPKK